MDHEQAQDPLERADVEKDGAEDTQPQERSTPSGTADYPPELLSVFMAFSGPLPPPAALEAYDRLVPGAAKQMHEVAVQQARHAMRMEELALEASIADRKAQLALFSRGQILTFLLTLVVIAVGAAAILTGYDAAGATVITGTVASLVLAFLWGRRARNGGAEIPDARRGPTHS